MGSVNSQKSVLILCGDYMEDYEIAVPYYAFLAFGIRADCVSPNKKAGHKCLTAVHEFLGYELYTELPGHSFTLNFDFDEVKPETYDALIIPGGRFTELLSNDKKSLNIVKQFAESNKIIFTSCHSQLMLASAGVLQGKKCTAFPSIKPVIELAGGIWWEQPVNSILEITACLKDGNLLSTIGWPTHAECIRVLFESLGARVTRSRDVVSVLFLCGDYVDDYEINVPFRTLQGFGCKVDAVTPNKKKGDSCVTAIYDDMDGAQICSEKRGHNFYITANWDDINLDDYDCVVVPGGRSPELLVMTEKAVTLLKKFAAIDGKVVAGIGQGQWLLAVAGLLKGKRCASSYGMKAIVKLAGGELVDESLGCVSHDKVVTAAGWSELPAFLSELTNSLGVRVVF